MKEHFEKDCVKCGKTFKTKPSHYSRRKFCSFRCRQLGKITSPETKKKISVALVGRKKTPFTEEHKRKIKKARAKLQR